MLCVEMREVVLSSEVNTVVVPQNQQQVPSTQAGKALPHRHVFSFIVMATLYTFNVFKTPLKVQRSQ